VAKVFSTAFDAVTGTAASHGLAKGADLLSDEEKTEK
jgi:hypothetical protein